MLATQDSHILSFSITVSFNPKDIGFSSLSVLHPAHLPSLPPQVLAIDNNFSPIMILASPSVKALFQVFTAN